MTPGPHLSDVSGTDGLRLYAKAGANEGANACAIATLARLSKFALVLCSMIHEVTNILGLHAVKRTPIDAGHPRGSGSVCDWLRVPVTILSLPPEDAPNLSINIAALQRFLFLELLLAASKTELQFDFGALSIHRNRH